MNDREPAVLERDPKTSATWVVVAFLVVVGAAALVLMIRR